MKRKKERFKIIAERDNVLEAGKEIYFEIKNNWHQRYFKNKNPITLELACGRGEYTIGLASKFRNQNFIGIDIKGERIWKGSSLATEQNLINVAFLRTPIILIENFFTKKNISTNRLLNNVWVKNKFFDDTKPIILLNSHHDTVKPNSQYTKNPFEPLIEDGKLFGLGSNDAGGPLVSIIACFLFFYDKSFQDHAFQF